MKTHAQMPISGNVLSVDPGGTTGLARYHSDSGIFAASQCPGNLLNFWNDLIVPYYIVCEDFVITTGTAKKTPQREALYIIGGFKYLEATQGIEFTLQSPSVKKTVPDVELKKIGWYIPGKPHANDASKHLIVFLRNRGIDV